jgi:hypothetical protein
MKLSSGKKEKIKKVLRTSLRSKFRNYYPETNHMPFHFRLLGKDRMALFSFIQSLNSTFGTSIYEPVAVALAEEKFKVAKAQVKPHNEISEKAHKQIQTIMDNLTTASQVPNKTKEIEQIRRVSRVGSMSQVKLTKVDIWLESHDGELTLIDFKTVKPNIGEFKGFKRTLLEWTAAEIAKNPIVKINTMIGIPYNPYEPEPYNRWTMMGMFDLSKEVLVADELWEFVGGKGAYNDLLDCFEAVGIELKPEIDEHFKKFR